MGMFDYLNCEYPLPAGAPTTGHQTKCLDCLMDTFTIRADGTLWGEEYDIEDRSDPNAEGLMALAGCMTRVNIRQVRRMYTGEVCFGHYDTKTRESWDFSAYFVNGELKHLEVLARPDTTPTVEGQ